ncbi:hypothetical protein PsorP6_006281 [Peronosclerospora sorghi]|uniref:Uncharacterized protein n=1 Tax=Peronosclerospora sorghi TaxID=230839 RepID=A0ACC0W7I2_9STRA|nr:hypothetical protein PsorP6_006281 [Peronosclerospora sorghi]
MAKQLSMTPGAIRARERRATLRKRAFVKDNSDGNAKVRFVPTLTTTKVLNLILTTTKALNATPAKANSTTTTPSVKQLAAISPLPDKVVNAALLTATLLNTTLVTTKVPNAKLTATKALNVIPVVTKTLNAIPAVTKALNENLAMTKTTTTTPTVKQLAISIPVALGGRRILLEGRRVPFPMTWLGNKTTQFIMDIDVHPEIESKTFSLVWLPDEPDVPSVLAFFMISGNVALKVYEEAKVHLANGKDQHLGVEITMDAAIRLPARVLGGYVNNINSVHIYKQDSRKILQCLKEHQCSQASKDHFLGIPYHKMLTGTLGSLTDVSNYLLLEFVGESYIIGSIQNLMSADFFEDHNESIVFYVTAPGKDFEFPSVVHFIAIFLMPLSTRHYGAIIVDFVNCKLLLGESVGGFAFPDDLEDHMHWLLADVSTFDKKTFAVEDAAVPKQGSGSGSCAINSFATFQHLVIPQKIPNGQRKIQRPGVLLGSNASFLATSITMRLTPMMPL